MTAKRGQNFDPDSDLIDPLDYLLIGGLPEVGTLIAGAYPDGRTSKQLSHELFKGEISAGKIGPRMNALTHHGFITKRKGVGTMGAHMYQRTSAGTTLHQTWLKDKTAAASEGGDRE